MSWTAHYFDRRLNREGVTLGAIPRFFASDPTFAAPREIPSRNRVARFRLRFSVVAAILTACCCVPAAPSNRVKQLRRWASVPKPADA